jgi:hypothetical protein
MNLQSIFGSVAIGKDSSGNFKQSVYGTAAKVGDNRFIARHIMNKKNGKKKDDGGHGRDSGGGDSDEKSVTGFIDVSDLTLDGTEGLFYRMPTKIKDLVPHQDIIIRSDNPFSVLFVEDVKGDVISGYDPSTGDWQEFSPLGNMLNLKFVVRVAGPKQLLDDTDSSDLLPMLLVGNSGSLTGGTGSNDPLSTLLLLKALGSNDGDKDKLLSTLMLLGNAGSAANTGNNALLTLLLMKGKDLF